MSGTMAGGLSFSVCLCVCVCVCVCARVCACMYNYLVSIDSAELTYKHVLDMNCSIYMRFKYIACMCVYVCRSQCQISRISTSLDGYKGYKVAT